MEEQGAYSLSAHERLVLARLAELVVPRDEFPSAADAGLVAFVEGVLSDDRPDWRPRVLRALEAAGAEPDLDAVLDDSDGALARPPGGTGLLRRRGGAGDGGMAARRGRALADD